MSEPRGVAAGVVELLHGVLHWTLHDDRIDFRSEAYAVSGAKGWVLVDPLPLDGGSLAGLGAVEAICLTGAFHQRSAWRYRDLLGAPVLAPLGAVGMQGRPDGSFGHLDPLPGGLQALRSHGPSNPHYVFVHEAAGSRRVLFVGDLLMRRGEGRFTLVPDDHQDDPRLTRQAVRDLLHTEPDVVCSAHGAPRLSGARDAILEALGDDS